MVASIVVDFAGTRAEAVAYAREHGFKAPQNYLFGQAKRANGCAVLSLPYKNASERLAAIQKFEEHGWDTGSQIDTASK